jgi:hypothetical protein
MVLEAPLRGFGLDHRLAHSQVEQKGHPGGIMRLARTVLGAMALLAALLLSACDVEKQMDAMVDNPSFADPLFAKFMAKPEYQVKAIDTILADPAMRQVLLEKMAASQEHVAAAASQFMADPRSREMIGQMLVDQPLPVVPDTSKPATP